MELASLLSASLATTAFKSDVHAFATHSPVARIKLARHAPPVKILRLIAQILDSQPDLAVEEISVDARSGCSDFSGVVDVYTAEAVHRFEFTWCCRWRAEQEGWKDYFGFPDQMRAAREYDFRCFAQWKSVKATQPSARHQLSLAR
ncbi:MAG: hypothetical protein M3466_11525 [Gemmatimonadota bacterium]|nr:hypothetical protein [Gemmatimonadota bacterium]